jgi:predicted transcriptional regulator
LHYRGGKAVAGKPLTVEEKEKTKVLIASGMSYHAVSKELGRSPHTVKRFALQTDTAVEIVEKKGELSNFFEDLARRMIESISDQDISRINAYQRTISAGIATDKMRLLREKSTQNISSILNITQMVEAYIQKENGGAEKV